MLRIYAIENIILHMKTTYKYIIYIYENNNIYTFVAPRNLLPFSLIQLSGK
jgi:hypothetical protein